MIARRRTAGPVPPPAAPPAAVWAGVGAALLLAGAATLAVQSTVVHAGWAGAPSWAGAALARVDGVEPRAWWAVVGGAALVLGLALLAAAAAPRRRTCLRIPLPTEGGDTTGGESIGAGGAGASVWARLGDLARMAGEAARGVPHVAGARVRVTRRAVSVRVVTDEHEAESVRTAVHRATAARLAPAAGALPIRVAVHRREARR